MKSSTKIDPAELPIEIDEETVIDMAQNGVIYGHKKSKTNPNMRPYISVNRQEIEIINPLSVKNSLEEAGEFLKNLIKENKMILFVGTVSSAKEAILGFSKEFDAPHVTSRWLGGTLTNFKVIRERTEYYRDLKEKNEKGELDKYTKKEKLDFTKEINKMSEIFEGLLKLDKVPDAVFIIDANENQTAIREAKKVGVPVVAVVDTDDDPKSVEYPIFANDHSRKSIVWVVDKLIEYIKGQAKEEKALDSTEVENK